MARAAIGNRSPLSGPAQVWERFRAGFADHETSGDDDASYRWSLVWFRWVVTATYIAIAFLLRPGQEFAWAVGTSLYVVGIHAANTVHTIIHTGRGRPVIWFYEATPFLDIIAASLILASLPSPVYPIWAVYLLVIFGASVSRRGSYVAVLTAACFAGHSAAVAVHMWYGHDIAWSYIAGAWAMLALGGYFASTRSGFERDLYVRVHGSEARTRALYELADTLGRADAQDAVYAAALASLERILGADRGAVLTFDDDGVMRFRAWKGLSPEYRAAVEGHSPWAAGDLNPQQILVPDVHEDPNLAGFIDVIGREGVRSLGFVPLVSQGRLLGKLMIYYDAPHAFGAEEVALLATIASHIAYAVERRDSEENMARMAYHDALTGLPNRNLLSDRFAMALAQARREVRPLAVLSLDLDQFKQVNDRAGHAAGDQALQEVARRLAGRLREVDTVARVGGDEFVVLIPGGNRDAAATVASAIQSGMRPAFACGGQSFHIGVSIGISLYPENADDPVVLLELADRAMYRAKANGQACSEFAVAADLPVGA